MHTRNITRNHSRRANWENKQFSSSFIVNPFAKECSVTCFQSKCFNEFQWCPILLIPNLTQRNYFEHEIIFGAQFYWMGNAATLELKSLNHLELWNKPLKLFYTYWGCSQLQSLTLPSVLLFTGFPLDWCSVFHTVFISVSMGKTNLLPVSCFPHSHNRRFSFIFGHISGFRAYLTHYWLLLYSDGRLCLVGHKMKH